MGRNRIEEDLRKESITISLPKYQIIQLRKIKNYNKLISELISKYIELNNL